MRTLSSLPAGLRYSSLATTPGGNPCSHYGSGAASLSPSYLSHARFHTPRRSPEAGSIRRRQAPSQRLGNFRSRRNFSNTPAARIALEEDDEDDGAPPPEVNRRPRRPEEIRASKGDLRQILASRKKPKRRVVLTPRDRVEIRKIEHMALSIVPASQFAQEFVDIKYRPLMNTLCRSDTVCRELIDEYRKTIGATTTWFEAQVRKSHNENRLLEHEYCKIHFREYPSLEERVRKSAQALSRLQLAVGVGIVEVLVGIVKTSEVSIRGLADLVEEDYLRPRKSARAKIDSLLAYSTRTQAHYHKLQAKGFAVLRTGAEIRTLLGGLSNLVVPGGPDFLALASATRARNLAVAQTAHSHRSYFLDSRELQDPLKDSSAHTLSRVVQRASVSKPAWQVVEAMVLDKPLKRVIKRKYKSVAIAIDAQYMKWQTSPKAATGVSSNRYLRQLDIMAPFETHTVMLRYLVHELWYLNLSMQGAFGPLWDGMPAPILFQFNQKMHQLTIKFREQQKDFLYETRQYRHINWIRLGLEEKLQQLGLPNEMQEKGLFVVSEPLSQDHPRFLRYIRSLLSLSYDSWFLNRVLATVHDQREGTSAFWVELMKKVHKRERLNPSGPQDLGSVTVAVALKKRRRRRLRSAPKTVARSHDKTKARRPQVQPSQMAEKDQHNNSDPRKTSSDKAQMSASSESGQTNKTVSFGTAMSSLMRPFWSHQKTDSKQTPQKEFSSDTAVPKSDKRTAASRPPTSDEESTKSAKKPWSANSASSKFDSPAERKRRSTVSSSAATETPQTTAGITSKEQQRIAALQATVKQLQAQVENLKAKKQSPPAPVPQRKIVGRRTFRSHSRRGSRRSYCTDSRFTHVSARDCSDESFPDQSFAVHVSSVTTIEDDPAGSTKNEFLPDQTSSSELIVKGNRKVIPSFWSHSYQRAPNGQKLIVHYCRTLESTEEVAKHFLNSKVIGFDMEWKAQVFASDSIQNNLSLIQIANEERIALFQIALFKPARNLEDFVAPSLRRILESPDITKVGVAIKADSTRLRKYLGIEARSIFELSHLFKLVKHGLANPKLVNKRSVNLSEQIQEHFGLPLEKSEDVRCSDWTRALNYRQVQYAATDPYACLCLFKAMEQKREAMDPVPPRPAHAELNQPIVIPGGNAVCGGEKESAASDPVEVDVAERS